MATQIIFCLLSPRFFWGKWFPFWRAYFSNGLVQPPTRLCCCVLLGQTEVIRAFWNQEKDKNLFMVDWNGEKGARWTYLKLRGEHLRLATTVRLSFNLYQNTLMFKIKDVQNMLQWVESCMQMTTTVGMVTRHWSYMGFVIFEWLKFVFSEKRERSVPLVSWL